MINESIIRAPVSLNLFNSLQKTNTMFGKPRLKLSLNYLINSIIYEHSCKILYRYMNTRVRYSKSHDGKE